MRRQSTILGFTLLEVMVAVAILGLALTAIFSSEAGAIKTGHRARNTTTASLLARCKMAELEERVQRDGLPAVEESGEDACCEHAEIEGFTCKWNIRRVVLPDKQDMEDAEAAGPLAGLKNKGKSPGKTQKSSGSPISALTSGKDGQMPGSVNQMLGGAGNPQDALAQMAFDFAFPILKPAIEEQVRRATVTVQWKEGTGDKAKHSFDVVQFLVQPPPKGGGRGGTGSGRGGSGRTGRSGGSSGRRGGGSRGGT